MQKGIISLVDSFSVGCVIDGGRVSLAHLMEFSHFVDLYVLEDDIYVDAASKKVELYCFDEDLDCPIRSLSEEPLDLAVFEVSNETSRLYNCAPTNYSFSIGSYDYWLKLTADERSSVDAFPGYKTPGRYDRDDLLAACKNLEAGIKGTIGQIARTKFSLMPSSRNLLPFLDAFRQIDTPAHLLYREASASLRKQIEEVISLVEPQMIYLPPLLSILLSRCESPSDIPYRLIELRAEYSDLRRDARQWFTRLDEATSLKDKIDIRKELEESVQKTVMRLENKRVAFYKEAVGMIVDSLQEGDLKKAVVKPTFSLLKKGFMNWIPDLLATKRFTGLIDLLDTALEVKNYDGLLSKVFGDSLDISQDEISDAKKYRKHIIDANGIKLPTPG